MLSSRNRAARFTLTLTILGIILSPLDWALQFLERSRTAREDTKSHGPHLIICGPARSGTTLVYQVLANTLPVAYPRNFTALFSRAPILASRLFTWNSKENSHPSYENYYGKTAGMQSPSEANHLWNQWVDSDSSGFRTKLSSHGADKMTLFFKRFSIQFGLPTLTKNNNANAFADAIAQRLDNAYFICLQRDKRYLAQSLVKARQEINGDISQSYGVKDSAKNDSDTNPISQVVSQIEYLEALALSQQNKIGAERFWIIDYETFCANPEVLIDRVKQQILGQQQSRKNKHAVVPELINNNRITDPKVFKQLEDMLARRSI